MFQSLRRSVHVRVHRAGESGGERAFQVVINIYVGVVPLASLSLVFRSFIYG